MAGLCEGGNEPPGSLKASKINDNGAYQPSGRMRPLIRSPNGPPTPPPLSLYRRPSEAADSLDRPPWYVVKRCWMASAMAAEADGALEEFAEAGMMYGFCRL
ncbi:hypothetical protein ANN_23232 [Periplaneta americana]|uniref:Uncharacterized protein n=1 Tax=Periplaneta americana TaxID=6978 RepID=A0ABQ8SKJ3_PERAM|nr:hypothetical protein ANN_23232 [Periplaneta americana]